jgi:hypothetical protein
MGIVPQTACQRLSVIEARASSSRLSLASERPTGVHQMGDQHARN